MVVSLFLDTSTLFKKYLFEPGSDKLHDILEQDVELIVSPITFIELNSIVVRKAREKVISSQNKRDLLALFYADKPFIKHVLWDESLEKDAMDVAAEFYLKSLDAIQLASAKMSGADVMLTSDKTMYDAAKKILKNIEFV